ncbi:MULTISPECIES: hypothetical protein [unclassified Lysinibacillus]|uniref:hypothetical protein n=1 Tax=unclassified Lysinibacillus TaxID=2636778 RepID=UPI00382319EC
MGLYSDTRTVEVTTAQIAEMVLAQKKAVELLADNKVNESIVRNTYASYGGAVLGIGCANGRRTARKLRLFLHNKTITTSTL